MKNILLTIILLLSTANFAAAQERDKTKDFNRAADIAVKINSNYPLKFSPATDILTTADKENLGKIAGSFKDFPNGTVIEIGAHVFVAADSRTNLNLSNRRAAAVKTALINLGVNPKALTTRAYGDKRPLYATENPAERQKNNRIEFLVSPNSFKENFEVAASSSGFTDKDMDDIIEETINPPGTTPEQRQKNIESANKVIDAFLESIQSSPNTSAAAPLLLNDDFIHLNKGWRRMVLGASEQEVKNALGEPYSIDYELLDDPKDVWIYDKQGLIVWFKKQKESKAVKISFFAGAKPDQAENIESYRVSGEEYKVKLKKVPFVPAKVAWWSSVEQVIAAYGKPDSQNKSELFGSSVTLLTYGETNFYFRRGELYQIALISKDF